MACGSQKTIKSNWILVHRVQRSQDSLGPCSAVSLLERYYYPLHCAVWISRWGLIRTIHPVTLVAGEEILPMERAALACAEQGVCNLLQLRRWPPQFAPPCVTQECS